MPILKAFAQSEALVHFEPASTSFSPGESVRVDLIIEDAQQFFGFEVHIQFDPEVIQIVDQDPDTPGVQLAPGDFFIVSQGFLVANQADNETGEILYAFTLLAPALPMDGDGILLFFDLQAVAVGQSELKLVSAIFASEDGESIPFSSQDGEVNIIGIQEVTPNLTKTTITLSPSLTYSVSETPSNAQVTLPVSTQRIQLLATDTPVETLTGLNPPEQTLLPIPKDSYQPEVEVSTMIPSPTVIKEAKETSRIKFETGLLLMVLFAVLFIIIRTARVVLQRGKDNK